MRPHHESSPARRAVNLSLNSDLVAQARAAGLNLSAIAEAAIDRALAEEIQRRFAARIADGIVEYEAYLAEFGNLTDAVLATVADGGA